MTEGVVNALELVEIETQDRQAFAALDALDLVIELFEQQHAIRQIRQRVMARHVRDAFFRTLTFGDIFVGREPAAAGDRLVDDRKSPAIRQPSAMPSASRAVILVGCHPYAWSVWNPLENWRWF